MGIFGSDSDSSGGANSASVIGKDACIEGEVKLDSHLHVDGTVRGRIESSGEVSIGLTGSVDGEVMGRKLLVAGTLEGKARAELVEISDKGLVKGDVSCVNLVIKPGGQFEGQSHRLTETANAGQADFESVEVVGDTATS